MVQKGSFPSVNYGTLGPKLRTAGGLVNRIALKNTAKTSVSRQKSLLNKTLVRAIPPGPLSKWF